MDNTQIMKMFLIMGDLTSQKETREDKLKYQERIVIATPEIIKPSDWDKLTIEEKEKRINNLKQIK